MQTYKLPPLPESKDLPREELQIHNKDGTVIFYSTRQMQEYAVQSIESYLPAIDDIDQAQLEQVNKALGEISFGAKLRFFLTPKGPLGGLTPLQALLDGHFDSVLNTAQAFVKK